MKCYSRFLGILAIGCALATAVRADEVTDWNSIMLRVALLPPATNPLVITRVAAIVHSSVFDAVNGIERRYTPIYVQPAAPRGASRRAAAVQAAYASLVRLYPAQKTLLDQELAMSLAGIDGEEGEERSKSIERGIEWGQTVADAIWMWRSTDGFAPPPPPFVGGLAIGEWRPTLPAFAPGAGPQFAYMTPWVIPSPSSFRPAGPFALSSAEYATVFNETKAYGRSSSSVRTADETVFANFWAASSATYSWNRIALTLAREHHSTLSQNARLLALLNLSMADAAIGCWEAKYHYVFWRPITAIQLAALDGNSATDADTSWVPLVATPPHPEYPSGHSCFSGTAGEVLTSYFGDNSPFTIDSDVLLGTTRSFSTISSALEEIKNARIFGGLHFRNSCNDGQGLGIGVADYVLQHVAVKNRKDDE
jgi:PAP2 superfamily